MIQEVFDIYERNFPFIVRSKETVLQILNNDAKIMLANRNDHNILIGVSVINQNTILLLCVDKKYRNKGIGTKLLAMSENTIKNNGFDQIVLGNGFDYIMPGVPTSKRYFDAENENLYADIDETASNFFTKRGYVHSWNCNCFDMRLPLNQFEGNAHHIEDTIDDITYRFATLNDLDGICTCTDDACQEFTKFYQYGELYAADSNSKVLIAAFHDEVVGTLIVGLEDNDKHFGSVGCTTVKPAYQGKHIAVNLVTIGTKYLKDIGVENAYLSYTYTGLDHMYGYAGYKICIYYMMAVKML